jgi:hypothetical protein
MRQCDDRLDDLVMFTHHTEPGDEHPVDLQGIDRELTQIAE